MAEGDEGQDTGCGCTEGVTCASCSPPTGDDLAKRLADALGEIERLNNKIRTIEKYMRDQNHRLRKLESSGDENSETEQIDTASIAHQQAGSASGTAIKMCKKAQVEDEMETEGDEVLDMSNIEELSRIRAKQQRDLRSIKKATRVNKVMESDTSSLCTESCEVRRRCKIRRKVKSGAKIKIRPVIRTELWPHTIANEDDSEEVTSEDIGLAKFLACFTYILTSCGRAESVGRALLLHAVTTVLECLPWAEARAFHNIVMVKLEQGRFDWDEDFTVLAEQYIDKKVRLNLRSRGSSYGNKSNPNNRSFGKSSSNSRNDRNFNSKPAFPGVCRNWNFSTCTYGERCNRSHVCLSCAAAGKPGEQHKASSHENSRGNESPGSRG